MKRLDEQTTRAVETMCLIGLDVDGLSYSFPGYTREELEAVLARVNQEKEAYMIENHSPISDSIFCNCS